MFKKTEKIVDRCKDKNGGKKNKCGLLNRYLTFKVTTYWILWIIPIYKSEEVIDYRDH